MEPFYNKIINFKHYMINRINIDLYNSCQVNTIIVKVLDESKTNWWENAWLWAAISAIVAIILRIIKLIYDYRRSKKSNRRYRGNR